MKLLKTNKMFEECLARISPERMEELNRLFDSGYSPLVNVSQVDWDEELKQLDEKK